MTDLRYALRMIRLSPGFAAAVIGSLALGIGANSAIFSVVNAFLLRPLPIHAPAEMVEIYTSNPEGNPYAPSSYPDYLEYRKKKNLFSGATAYMLIMATLRVQGDPEVALGEMVTENYFDVLGVRPALGRGFLPEEGRAPGAHPVVVISDSLWRRRFGADSQVLGKVVFLNRLGYTVVGVAPPEFKGLAPGLSADFWAPTMMLPWLRPEQPNDLDIRENRGFFIKARLQPEVGIEKVQAELSTLAYQLEQAYPENKGHGVTVLPTTAVHFHPRIDRALMPVSALLMSVVGLVLLIACTNVANLLLARGYSRRKEVAMRLALGASRPQIIRQLLTESTVLALAGGAVGLLLASWLIHLLATVRPPLPIPLALDLGIDSRVLFFTSALSLVTGLLFGLLPALQASKPQLVAALKDEQVLVGPNRFRLRKVLLATQVAISLLLLIGAGLFVRSLANAQSVDPGFEPASAGIVWMDVGVQGYDEARGKAFYERLLEETRALPGVRSATLTDRLPLDLAVQASPLFAEGQTTGQRDEGLEADFARVAPDYFRTLGIPLRAGRDFTARDSSSSPRVVIINETAARRLWPGGGAVGKRLHQGSTSAPPFEVVGVARDVKVRSLGEEPRPFFYIPFSQDYESAMQLVASTEGEPKSLLPLMRRRVEESDPDLEMASLKTMQEHMSVALFPIRAAAGMLTAFGLLALLLACVGIYGLTAYFVTQRTHEVGIRMALGAEARDILKLILFDGAKVVGIGMGLGLVLALVIAPFLSRYLLGISAQDPLTFVGIPLLLGAVALAAIFIPGRRATRVEPTAAISQR